MAVLLTLACLSYPLLSHSFIHLGRPDLAVYALGLLLMLFALASVRRQRRFSRAALLILATASALLLVPGWQGIDLVRWMPVGLNLLLAVMLGQSLSAGQTPLITRFAAAIRGTALPQPVQDYTRKVTLLWMLFFIVMALVGATLAVFASLQTWSWFANVLSWLLVTTMLVLEFLFRRWYLGAWVDYRFVDFVKGLVRLDYAGILRQR